MKKIYITISFLLVIVFLLIYFLFYNNKRLIIEGEYDSKISFYYRDSADLDSLYPELSTYDVYTDNKHAKISNRQLSFLNPEEIDSCDICISLYFQKGTDTINKKLYTRCWINNVYRLVETTDNKILKGSLLYYYYNRFKIKYTDNGYQGLYILGDSTYIFNNGSIYLDSRGEKKLCGNMVLEDPIYLQIIRGDEYLFLRNNNKIYVTEDNFRSSKLIYSDRRAIRESMVWDSRNRRLLFTMYTPGNTRVRHYLLAYDTNYERIDTLQTFFTESEHSTDPTNTPYYCRHIHLLNQDPYSKQIYLGLGDGDSGILTSSDYGASIDWIGCGDQSWRTLSLIYSKKYIFWTTDSDSPQYIYRINKISNNNKSNIYPIRTKYPLFNSAIWCNEKISEDMYALGSNSEGCLYDDFHRIYGVLFDSEGVPTVYNLLEEKSINKYHQIFPIGVDYHGIFWAYDNKLGLRSFQLVKK